MEMKELDNGNLLLSFKNSDDLNKNFVPFMYHFNEEYFEEVE